MMNPHGVMKGIHQGFNPTQKVGGGVVFAVAAGAHVTFSSSFDYEHVHYQLDSKNNIPCSWSAKQNKVGEWIQVSQESPKYWAGIIIQGRGDLNQWVKTIRITYTLDGQTWESYGNGQIIQANHDKDTKVDIHFNPIVYARALRIYPH